MTQALDKAVWYGHEKDGDSTCVKEEKGEALE